MKNLTLSNIAEACGGKLCNYKEEVDSRTAAGATENATANSDVNAATDSVENKTAECDREATCVVVDSRLIEEGGIFIATKGERVDGHTFINQVADKGALGVICETEPENCKIPYILVEDSFQALKDVAEFYRKQMSLPIVGITGSVGKTSTKEFIAGVLGVKYRVLKTQGNFNNEVGVPLTLLSIRDEHQVAVVEMGISDFGEMTRLTRMVKPDTCVITNIGQCHLENLKDRDGVLRAKTEIFKSMNPKGCVYLNGDDDKLSTVKKPYEKEIVFFGTGKSNDVYADNIVNKGLLGSDATITFGHGQQMFTIDEHISLPGKHMVINATVASAIGIEYGLTLDEIAEGVANVAPTGGRSHVIDTGKYILIDDCYNANPVSMKAAIDLLNTANTRKVAILGDMFELGENEKDLHRQIGEYASTHGVDVLITIGELSKNMYLGVLESAIGGTKVSCFDNKSDAINELGDILKDGDSILIKASHGMHFEELVEVLSKV